MYIILNEQNIYYQKLGRGKDVIMLHGWGQDVASFHNIAQKLKDYFTIYLIDLPGFGRSETPKIAFNIKDFAEIIKDFIIQNELNKPHLLGHSVGGNISIKLAAEHGEIIDRLVLESSSGIRPQGGINRDLVYVLAKTFKFLVPNVAGIKDKIRHNLYCKLESDYINAGGLKDTLTNILSEDLTTSLSKIKNQTLLIWGDNDEQVKITYARKMYKKIPNSRLEVLENVGHFPHIENHD